MTDMHFIKGTTLAGTSGRSKNVFNPATGLVVGSVPLANASEVDAAVAAAKPRCPAGRIHHLQNVHRSCLNFVT